MAFTGMAGAQTGIGTLAPDTSAVLDLHSSTKGFLMPTMTTTQRDLIGLPAKGLMIFNQQSNAVEVNNGTPLVPAWYGMMGRSDTMITSINATGDLTTSSTTTVMIPGMTLTPQAGTYLVMFNGQYGPGVSEPINTGQGVTDLQAAYNAIMAIPATNTTHAAVFGSETLTPGVYTIPAAGSVAGILTLDGGGDTNAVFIIRAGGAFNTGANTTVTLTNGARANNVFWVAEGALGLGASTIMKGTLISHNAAVSAAAGSNVEGRMLTTAGAIGFGPGTIAIPTKPSYINLGIIETFAIFTTAGAVGNTGPSFITGNVGSNAGAITGFGTFNGATYGPGQNAAPVNNTLATFSIYQNGVLVANSSRTSDVNTSTISLQAVATVATGQSIDIRWKVDAGPLTLGNRIITLINIH